jgi:antitoxin (DNA-binding transcriptional repressor) of toxin-antitoxin stability system
MIINIHEAKTKLSKLIALFQEGEEIIIAKNGKPLLKFASIEVEQKKQRSTGFLNCNIDMSTFDDPIEGLEEYL